MQLKVELPNLLRSASWRLRFRGIAGERFVLGPGEKRLIIIELVPGRDFTPEQTRDTDDRDIQVTLLADGMALGGMTYRLDPSLETPPALSQESDRRARARDLLRCLGHTRCQDPRRPREEGLDRCMYGRQLVAARAGDKTGQASFGSLLISRKPLLISRKP